MSRYALAPPTATNTWDPRCPHCGELLTSTFKPLTRRQRELYSFIFEAIAEKGYAPSFDEIAKAFNYTSLATVHEHLTNLERKGYIRRAYNEARSIQCLVDVATWAFG